MTSETVHDPALIARLTAGRQRSDPAADAVVALLRTPARGVGSRGWALLEAAMACEDLDAMPDLPDEIRQLLQPIRSPPSWLDPDLADAGAMAFWKAGSPPVSLALACGSLAFGYQSAHLVRTLAATGRLEQMASRRLGETARWVLEATTPGGMRVDGPGAVGAGVAVSVRVRLVHALVREHLLRSKDWDVAAWGVPISASDAVATAIGGFHIMPVRAMRDLGVRHSAAELEAMTHLWRWTGYVMGVPQDLLPATYAEACELIDAGLSIDPGPNDDSRLLMAALLQKGVPLDRFIPRPATGPAEYLVTQVLGAFTRRWMGEEMADRLAVPSSPLRHLVPALRPLALARETIKWTGLLGSDEALVAREIAAVKRTLRAGGAARATLDPRDAAREPVLRRAA